MADPVPAPPDNPKVCKVTMIHDLTGRQLLNTFHLYKASAPWVAADLSALATAVYNWWTLRYAPCLPIPVTLRQIQLRVYNTVDPWALDFSPGSPPAGQLTGQVEAGNVSVTLSERTGLAGRRHRGRMYVPGISAASVNTTDQISSTLAALLATAGTNLLIAFASNNAVPVVFHRPNLPPSGFDNGVDIITSFVVETILDSMRRRLPTRGR